MAAYGYGKYVERSKTYKNVVKKRKGVRIIWEGVVLGR